MTPIRPSEHAVEVGEMENEIIRLRSVNKQLVAALRGLLAIGDYVTAEEVYFARQRARDALSAEVPGSVGDMVATAAVYGQAIRTPDGRALSPHDYTDDRDALTRDFDAIMTGIRSIRWRDKEWEESGPERLQRFRRALYDTQGPPCADEIVKALREAKAVRLMIAEQDNIEAYTDDLDDMISRLEAKEALGG